jgi:transposase
MAVAMIYVKELSHAEIVTLTEMQKHHPLHLSRKRAQAILLSHKGDSIPMLCETYDVCRQTVSTWFSKWEREGICGLVDRPGRGRKPLLDEKEEKQVVELINESPRSLKIVSKKIEQEMGVTITIDKLKSICIKKGLVWKRVRQSLRSKRNQADFEASELEIRELIQQHKEELIDLCYFDESGFTLEPCIPYAWQPVNKTIEIPSSKSRRLNVLGFVNRDCEFESWVFEGTVTSSVVVACFNKFSDQIMKPTTVVIDNASFHTSYEFNDRLTDWEKKGLHIYRLPAYSPELNIIEIVWRKIKYEWLPFSAYESYSSLKEELFDVLSKIGQEHIVSFQ